jgi:hypothetical protein
MMKLDWLDDLAAGGGGNEITHDLVAGGGNESTDEIIISSGEASDDNIGIYVFLPKFKFFTYMM